MVVVACCAGMGFADMDDHRDNVTSFEIIDFGVHGLEDQGQDMFG